MKGGRNSGLPWNRKMMSKSVNKLLAASSQHEISTVTGLGARLTVRSSVA